MRIEDIVKKSVSFSKKLPPSIGYELEKASLNMLTLPVFEFGKFDYGDFIDILSDSATCWNEGLLNFPFDECVMMHDYRTINIPKLTQTHDDVSVYHIKTIDDFVDITEWRVANTEEHGETTVPPFFKVRLYRQGERKEGDKVYELELLPCKFSDPTAYTRAIGPFKDACGEFIDTPLAMAMYLNTTGVIAERLPAPEALNKARIKRGKLPLPDRYVVRLDFKHQQVQRGDGTHASPRPHYRRGHVRTYASGEKTWVKACIVAGTADTACAPTYVIKG